MFEDTPGEYANPVAQARLVTALVSMKRKGDRASKKQLIAALEKAKPDAVADWVPLLGGAADFATLTVQIDKAVKPLWRSIALVQAQVAAHAVQLGEHSAQIGALQQQVATLSDAAAADVPEQAPTDEDEVHVCSICCAPRDASTAVTLGADDQLYCADCPLALKHVSPFNTLM